MHKKTDERFAIMPKNDKKFTFNNINISKKLKRISYFTPESAKKKISHLYFAKSAIFSDDE